MRRKVFAACAALALVLALLSGARADDKVRIGISSSWPGFLPTVVAEKKGFFTK